MNKVVFFKNAFTGGHYCFKTEKSKKPFTNPMTQCKSVKLNSDDIVADVGAYVGEYSIYASKSAKKINSYEATPGTFKVLSHE